MPGSWSERNRWSWQLPPIAPVSSVAVEIVGTKQLCQRGSPLGFGWRSDGGSPTLCPSMAHSPSDGHVGYIVLPQIAGSCKNPGMPSQYLVCPEVAICQRIHLWEGKSASNRPCENSNASPDRCGQEPWILVAFWGRADVVASGTFLEHVCLVVGCPGRNSRSQVWVGADIPTAREETGCVFWVIQQSKVVWRFPGVQALTVRRCCVVTPVDMLAVEVTNVQTGVWKRRDVRWGESRAWRFVDVDDLASCDVYA